MAAEYLYELMSTQRAIRRLKADPIPEDVLERIKRAAVWAPSGGNQQPWRMILVRDRSLKERLGELYTVRWSAYVEGYVKRFEDQPEAQQLAAQRAVAAGDYMAANMGSYPVIAVVCFNPKLLTITDAALDRPSVVGGGSVYLAVQNLMLACRAEGIGCVLTTLLCMDEPVVRELLQIDPDWYTAAHIPMGYPVGGGYGPTSRRDPAAMFFEDAWGNSA